MFSLLTQLFFRAKDRSPSISAVRYASNKVAIIFLHGFSGSALSTWSSVLTGIESSVALSGWDIFSINYSTSLRIDIPHVWSADPPLDLLSSYLRTLCSSEPLSQYNRIAIVAHSMGGLVVQKAIVEDSVLRSKLSHVMLFGTPSGGLFKASLSRAFKRQLRDMGDDSKFITELRQSWANLFPDRPPFAFRVVAGETDEFVPPSSSLYPFQDEFRRVVQGNHLSMLSSNKMDVDASQLLIEFLCDGLQRSIIDSARLAVEVGEFRDAISQLLPNAANLDVNALASLALALETLNRTEEAIEILETYYKRDSHTSTTDAFGILAGRIKRRWLVQRSSTDLSRALTLYREAYGLALEAEDERQCYYHSINVAFLLFVSAPPNSSGGSGKDEARKALQHCAKCIVEPWRIATEAEAHLILDNIEDAIRLYQEVATVLTSPREIQSTYSQAIKIAVLKSDQRVAERIKGIFFPNE